MNANSWKDRFASHRTGLVCLTLAAATLAVYWQVGGFDFACFDDDKMILDNPAVLGGVTRPGLWWGLTTFWFEYWHPVTWWSHMLDVELFGLDASAHHLVSLAFHVANTLLLFVVLRRMTGAFWRSAMVAALFALHPLHVESVAWVAERKDVLSACFFLLTLWAYTRYAEESRLQAGGWRLEEAGKMQKSGADATHHAPRTTPPIHQSTNPPIHPSIFYLLSLLFFALGLMSKPMVVTLPFVLLLLDYWPFQRFQLNTQHSNLRTLLPLVGEKLPFFALTLASCVLTYRWALASGNTISTERVSWALRLANLPVSYAQYLWKTIWPVKLTVVYPMPDHLPWWQVAGAMLVLVLITGFAVMRARTAPHGIVGWLIFLGMLFPTIRLVQSGFQSIADRYTYLPLIGLFVAVVWGARTLFARGTPASAPPGGAPGSLSAARAAIAWGLAGFVLSGYATASWVQLGHWRNREALWTHALAVTQRNAAAHQNYGLLLDQRGQIQDAIRHYREALRIQPRFFEARNNLGMALFLCGATQEATNQLLQAVQHNPGNLTLRVNLGRVLAAAGDWAGARRQYETAMTIEPANPTIPIEWGKSLLGHYQAGEAVGHFARALRLDPTRPEARIGYAFALGQVGAGLATKGKWTEAAERYREAIKMQPDLPEVLNNLAWLLATTPDARLRNGPEAVDIAERACLLDRYEQPMFLGTLAAAYAEAGRFDEARKMAEKAIQLAEAAGQPDLAARNRDLLKLYEAGKPCRQ